VPPLFLGADAATWLYRSLVLLVVSCPCALVISTPVSIVSALSAAARNGVLIKGGAYLEALSGIRTVAFDKTGTLTTGQLEVTDLVAMPGHSTDDVLRYAAAVELRSEHPVARAIVSFAASRTADLSPVTGFASAPGMGAEGHVAGLRVLVGNEALLADRRIPPPESADIARLRGAGRSFVFVAVSRTVIGAIAVADRPRQAAREAIELLRAHGVTRVVMLTGDHPDTARAVAEALGVGEHHAALLPDQKYAIVQALRRDSGPVMMVGDGVNDAPALAAADIGVAMGAAGSDTALETADVALMSDELLKLPYALRLARATLRNVKTNVVVSLVLKAAFLVLAVAGMATLWMAVLADTGASVIVVANALRLLRTR
jgi:Cd2+/Zn2+-exporting ATPase